MPNGSRQKSRKGNMRRNNNSRISTTPRVGLTRTFRTFANVSLDNATGSGNDEYAFFSRYYNAKPSECADFRDAQTTFELWRLKNMRIKLQPGYNGFNQTYNTINQDAIGAMQCWTCADLSANELVSGISITSYNNARVSTLSLNGLKTVVNTRCKLNDVTTTPKTLLPYSTWLDTSTDLQDSKLKYSGAQVFLKMPFKLSTDFIPMVQVIIEYDVEFKQPAWQNRPTSFELGVIGSILEVQPVPGTLDLRPYVCKSYKIDGDGGDYRFERQDGEPGSLNFTQKEFWEVFYTQTSGTYFGGRKIKWTGPIPRKPQDWTPDLLTN